ncbi:constitutive coactivator of peroxisome proliferator-activated receptor gamma isoform X2 [Phyllopteryx taeniolatus]|uniref:constitutive coactivator of peroxisome proliferator-activated receptor gamma isoform X2 n=1 Tax=Phyllopteryx taeniolatus TaxID=161469 RepID=UPI002AD2F5CA|nr:constitutive coactivator of peroxisome proliferator-activated receptor gamma isoform X2 [Phyllopteryx taeniolatus]XP_061621945.1 constitutive coactivator of peroxisome proliferator-activated receptor gamma isoform X2 [Phyllopteryx taeniolatus]XP_061621946.1 constitutive coactivator of peroxisome proliferator-activated receptor gamma isoform X2 [Phyllopteryx taeniolatus]
MGVKGLQYFMERCCPESCVTVDLREMVKQHVPKTSDNTSSPTLVVDGMACLRHWYLCKDWVCGGQWNEYMSILRRWVETFTSAGIRLVFFFDGVVEEKKRHEWVKRRRRVNGQVSKLFRYIKLHGEQPGKDLFTLPSGLATFTPFALRTLGQDVFCSVQEADYEIACYARRHGCMGILGQDSDFIIYDSVPYLSVAKLQLDRLTTVLYDRERLCRAIGLDVSQLPLLACLLGNDVVPEERMQAIRNSAWTAYRKPYDTAHSGAPQRQMVLAVSQFVSSLWGREEEERGLIPQTLKLTVADRQLLEKGICSYLLAGPEASQRDALPPITSTFEKRVSPEILKACVEKHVSAEGFMVYNVVCEGVIECSNSLEDEEDRELVPQAVVYKSCRQRIYGLLLLNRHDDSTVEPPAIREWFVYPGNPLKEPDMVLPIPICIACEQPSLDLLWFSSGPEVSALRLMSFLSIFDCQELAEMYGVVEDFLLAALCLVTYIALQVPSLCSEDVDAYLSQAVCLRLTSLQELQQIKLPFLSSRAVQLGSLYVRGLSYLLGANCASGCPLPTTALMPWQSFDGQLFHSKYLLAHSGTEQMVLLDNLPSSLAVFLQLREKHVEVCMKRNRVLQSRPRASLLDRSHSPRYRDGHTAGVDNWPDRGEASGGWRRGSRQCSDGNNRVKLQERPAHRGRGGGGQYSHPRFHPPSFDGSGQNLSSLSEHTRSGWRPSRGRYQLAPSLLLPECNSTLTVRKGAED